MQKSGLSLEIEAQSTLVFRVQKERITAFSEILWSFTLYWKPPLPTPFPKTR